MSLDVRQPGSRRLPPPKTIVITQSNYIPWRGYFDLLRSADEVILLDSVQFTKRDWRNRNRIKTPKGPAWLTIPVEVKGRYAQAIDETRIADPTWAETHIRSIASAYAPAAYYDAVAPWLFDLLRAAAVDLLLTRVNEYLLREFCARLQITTPILRCTDVIDSPLLRAMTPTERLIALVKARGATRYLTGPAARRYLDLALLSDAGIDVAWMSYDGYADYQQLWGEFDSAVSIVDLLLNTGDEAPRYLTRMAT